MAQPHLPYPLWCSAYDELEPHSTLPCLSLPANIAPICLRTTPSGDPRRSNPANLALLGMTGRWAAKYDSRTAYNKTRPTRPHVRIIKSLPPQLLLRSLFAVGGEVAPYFL